MLDIRLLQAGLAAGCLVVGVCFILLILLRWVSDVRRARVEIAVRKLEPVIHAWLVLDRDVNTVRDALRDMEPMVALRSLARIAAQQATFQQQQSLAHVLRDEAWVGAILSRATSPFWWRRFDAARLLSVVSVARDKERISALLRDSNAAVRLVAMDAAARLQGRVLLDEELDTLPLRQDAVQAYQMATLMRDPAVVGEALIPRLTMEAPAQQLAAWIDVAGAIASSSALERVRELARHPLAEVRVHVARALRRLADPGTPPVLISLLQDDDWRVRAQAARALGALRCGDGVAALSNAVRDRSWWVRYRAALALSQIGGIAHEELNRLARSDDAMARDMSVLVGSLSRAAVVEMSEV